MVLSRVLVTLDAGWIGESIYSPDVTTIYYNTFKITVIITHK
jgi:hypothetical protein